jgi:Rrf2 family protein
MKISTKGRYALRVMLDLAMHDSGGYITLKDVAARQKITAKYLEQIIALLNKAGFLISTRGSTGGHRLAGAPKNYTVGEVLRATEGSLSPVPCLDSAPDSQQPFCELETDCLTKPIWEGLYKLINDYVDGITLQDILNTVQTDNYVI